MDADDPDEEEPNHSWERRPAVLWVSYVDALAQGLTTKIAGRLQKFNECIRDVHQRCEHGIHDAVKAAKWKRLIEETDNAIATSTQPMYRFIS